MVLQAAGVVNPYLLRNQGKFVLTAGSPHFGRLETPSPPGTYFALRLFRIWSVQFWQSKYRAGSLRQPAGPKRDNPAFWWIQRKLSWVVT